MKLFDIMKNFNEEIPPQNVELLVCDNPADPENRIFERVCFFRKGTLLPHEYRAKGNNDVERFFDHLENEQSTWKPAPQTGYYMLVHCPKEGRSMYRLCTINPLDSKYIIINPLDDDEVEF